MDEQKLKKKLQELAGKNAIFDHEDLVVYDAAGGNIDDAYFLGCGDGKIGLARDLLAEFFDE